MDGLPTLFSRSDTRAALKATHEQQVEDLYAQIGRLTTQVAWLKRKSGLDPGQGRADGACWERERADLPLAIQTDLLSLNRTSLYYKPASPSPEEVALKHRIDEVYTAHPYYGSRRIAAQLRREAVPVNRKAVQRHMREMGIAGIAPGPNTSKRTRAHRVYPIDGGLLPAAGGQVLVTGVLLRHGGSSGL